MTIHVDGGALAQVGINQTAEAGQRLLRNLPKLLQKHQGRIKQIQFGRLETTPYTYAKPKADKMFGKKYKEVRTFRAKIYDPSWKAGLLLIPPANVDIELLSEEDASKFAIAIGQAQASGETFVVLHEILQTHNIRIIDDLSDYSGLLG
jgi:hypothetical protein